MTLDIQPQTELQRPGFETDYAERWLTLPPGMSFEAWQLVGQTLARIQGALKWWWGDWLQYGEFTYGEMYAQAVDETGLDYGTLANYKFVASRFESSRRNELLSWSHHAVVAGLEPEQADALLADAVREHLHVAEFRRYVQMAVSRPAFPKQEEEMKNPSKLFDAVASLEHITGLTPLIAEAWVEFEQKTAAVDLSKDLLLALGKCIIAFTGVLLDPGISAETRAAVEETKAHAAQVAAAYRQAVK